MTASDIINLALKDAGVIGEGQTPSSETVHDSLTTLQNMLDLWELENLSCFSETQVDITATGSGTYTLGPTGTTVLPTAPYKILYVNYALGTTYYTLEPVTNEDMQSEHYIPGVTGIPTIWSYNPQYPNGVLTVYPIPASGILEVWVETTLAEGLTLTTTMLVPLAYAQAIRFNLAVLLAVTFGTPARTEIAGLALSSKRILSRANVKINQLKNGLPVKNTTFKILGG